MAVCLGAATRNWLLQGLPEVDPPHQNVKIQFTSVLSTETQPHQAMLVGSLMICCLKCGAALQAAASGLVRAVQAVTFSAEPPCLWEVVGNPNCAFYKAHWQAPGQDPVSVDVRYCPEASLRCQVAIRRETVPKGTEGCVEGVGAETGPGHSQIVSNPHSAWESRQ